MEYSERYKRGLEKLQEIDGEVGKKVVESLKDISPDLGRFIIEYVFGDVYVNNRLAPELQELAVVAALASLGSVTPQLKIHIQGALNVGCTIDELKELFLQMALTSGFPKALNATFALKEVLQERKEKALHDDWGNERPTAPSKKSRYDRGKEKMFTMDPTQFDILNKAFGQIAPELLHYILEFVYGEVITRTTLSPKKRQIAIISSLAALANVNPQLRVHIRVGLNIGLTVQEIKEIMFLISVYAGFPACTNGINILKKVVEEREE